MNKDKYVAWLNDAYAMETDITKKLEKQVEETGDYPDIKEKIQEHLEVTRQQAERLKTIIERHGKDVSSAKSMLANMMGMVSGASMGMMPDKIVKAAEMDYALEHFEIAKYKGLITAAQVMGEEQDINELTQSLQEEEEMAEWIGDHTDKLVREYIAKET